MKPLLRHILAAVLVCCATPAHAQEEARIIEQWECFDSTDYILKERHNRTVLVRLTRLRAGNSDFGKVESLGNTHEARFTIRGLALRWDFGNGYKYAFIIGPDKVGTYTDFISPPQRFRCEKR